MQRYASRIALVFLIGAVIYSTACGDFFVSGSTLDHITVTPGAVFLAQGETLQFTANGVNVDGTTADITSSATWTTGAAAVATVNAGLVTAANVTAVNNTTVTAAQGSVNGVGTVVVGTAPLNTSLTVTGPGGTTTPTVNSTTPVQLIATGTAGGSIILTNLVTWASNSTTITVSNTGLVSATSAATTGQTAVITATIATKTATATGQVTVTIQ